MRFCKAANAMSAKPIEVGAVSQQLTLTGERSGLRTTDTAVKFSKNSPFLGAMMRRTILQSALIVIRQHIHVTGHGAGLNETSADWRHDKIADDRVHLIYYWLDALRAAKR